MTPWYDIFGRASYKKEIDKLLVKIAQPLESEYEYELLLKQKDKRITNFRPKNFGEYVGQDNVKQRIEYFVEGIKLRGRIFPHTLIHGAAGMGKTTLAQILANMLNVAFIEAIASDVEDIETIKNKIALADGGILFLDEIHSLPRNMAEKFYPIMEDFRYENINIKPFTLIGATTELGEMIEDRKPFVDRFKNIIELEDYTIGNLVEIAKQYKDKEFINDVLDLAQLILIAENCRNTPRTLIRLLEATIYFHGNIKAVLDNFGIVSQGFTKKDIKILEYLVMNNKGCGLTTLANYLDTSIKNYMFEIEPFLLKKGIIIKTGRGRKITDKGLFILDQLRKGI